MTAHVLELNVLFLVAGAGILWGARGWRSWRDAVATVGVSYMLGLATVCVAATVALVAGLGMSKGVILGLSLGVALVGAGVGAVRRMPLPSERGTLRMPRTVGEWLGVAGAAVTVVVALEMYRAFHDQPLIAYDAFAFWVPKAKAIYFFGGLDESIFRSLPGPSYPLLVPALDAMVFRFVHSADPVAIALQYWFLLVGFFAAAAYLLHRVARRGLVWLFLALAILLPEIEHRWFQIMADWPLDVFFVLAALFVLRWTRTREHWLLVGFTISLAALLATKREGQLLAACLFAGVAVATIRTWRRHWPLLLSLGAIAYAVNVPWRIWWTSRHLTGDTPDHGLGNFSGHLGRFFPSLHIVLDLVFSYHLWLLCVPIGIAAAVGAVTLRDSRAPAAMYLVTGTATLLGFTWVLWSDPTLPLSTKPALTPIPRAVGSLALFSLSLAPVLVSPLVSERTYPVLDLDLRTAWRTWLPQLAQRLAAARVSRVLAAFVVVQWLVVLELAKTIRHTSWIFYQGGDQLWYYTGGWLLGHGHFTDTSVGYLWSALLAPGTILAGPNYLELLPLIVLVDVLVLLPVAMLALYGIAARIGGRLFAYWVLAAWIVVPLIGIKYADAGYHQRYTELTLPQAFGLTGQADFPMMVATLVAVYFCVRVAFDERPQLAHAIGGGLAAGAAIAIKPSAGLFVLGPALVFVATRRVRSAGLFAAAMVPALVTLAYWKYRAYGQLPIVGAAHSADHVIAAAAPLLALNLHKYYNFDWSHFLKNLDEIREHFWSARLIEWLVIGGLIGLARRSFKAVLLIGGWFAAYVVVKGTYTYSNITDGSLFRLMIPAFPAFVLVLASLPFLLPGVTRRLRPQEPGPPLLDPRRRRIAVVAAIVVTSIIPFAAIAVASPVRGPLPKATFVGVVGEPPIPNMIGIGLKATVQNGAVHLSWTSQSGLGGPVFYHLYRDRVKTNVYLCATGRTAPRCEILLARIGTTHGTRWVDRPKPGVWSYRVGPAANWLNSTAYGDVYLMSTPITVTVP